MPAPPPFWDGVLRRLGADLPAFALDAWVRPLRVESAAAGLRLVCPTPFHRERVRERFAALIARRVDEETGSRLPIEVELAFEARLLRVEGRRLFVSAEVEVGGVRTAEAEGLFTAVGGEKFEAFVRARRERGRD